MLWRRATLHKWPI